MFGGLHLYPEEIIIILGSGIFQKDLLSLYTKVTVRDI